MFSPAAILLGFGAAPVTTAPPIHSPAIEARLGYLVGDWIIQGLSSATFRQKCAWYSARSFVVCTSKDQRDGILGETIFGYSELGKRFTYYHFDSKGRSVYQQGVPSGIYGIVFTDERIERDVSVRTQTTINLEDEGLRYTQYRSVQGRAWQRAADFLYVPAVEDQPVRKKPK
jgi:hypothetical protein